MGNLDQKITGVRVFDIAEEINQQDTPIMDVQVTDNHCFLLLGEKK
jgi:hypothetical protein